MDNLKSYDPGNFYIRVGTGDSSKVSSYKEFKKESNKFLSFIKENELNCCGMLKYY